MKLAIIESRGLSTDIAQYIPSNVTEIISGGAKGIDTLAKEYANLHKIALTEYLPKYEKYRRNAPLLRNKKIVEQADSVLALWDGKSKGTKYTIDYAKKIGKPVNVVIL